MITDERSENLKLDPSKIFHVITDHRELFRHIVRRKSPLIEAEIHDDLG